MAMNDLLARIREEVQRQGLRKADLVAATGLDWKTVDNVLEGDRRPSRATVNLVARVLGLSAVPSIPAQSQKRAA
jgi:transcriptional regulator with XRE-family HTH domain